MFKLRFFLGSSFRLFVLFSLMLHVGVGLFLGVPSWELMMTERKFEQTEKEKAKEAAKAAAKAKAAALEETRQAIEKQLHDQFNKLNSAIPEATREKLWKEVASKLEEKTRSFADALGRDSVTEQDLQNLAQQMDRDLVEQTDEALTAETAQEMAERFIEQIEDQVIPELARSMHEQVALTVAAQLSQDATQIVKQQAEGARQELATKAAQALATLQAASQKLQQAEGGVRATNPETAVLQKAGQTLAAAEHDLAVAQEQTPDTGKNRVKATLQAMHQAQTATQTAAQTSSEQRTESLVAAGKTIDEARQAIQAAKEALGGAAAIREQYVSKDLRKYGEGALKKIVEQSFAKEFYNETIPRLTPKLVAAFTKELSKNDLKNDALVKEVAKRTSELLAARVPALAQAGVPVEERFQRLAPEEGSDKGQNSASNTGQKLTGFDIPKMGEGATQDGADALASSALDQQLSTGKAKMAFEVQQKMGAIAKNGNGDDALVQKAIGRGLDGTRGGAMADTRDSMGRMVEGMRNGRMGSIGGEGSRLGDLRQLAYKWYHTDHAAYLALSRQIADRGTVQGEEWKRTGASGATSHAADEIGMGPSYVTGPDNALAKVETGNTEPYKPLFKTLAFASIPCLPGTFVCDGQAGKWEGIPSITLNPEFNHPELNKDLSVQSVQIGWRNDGLFFRYTITDSDHHITKNSVAQFWVHDLVEIWLDMLNSKKKNRSIHDHDVQQFWVWPEGSLDDPLLTGGEATLHGNLGLRKEALPRTTVMTEQGYILEFELPAALISNCDLTPGRIIGLNTTLRTNGSTTWYWSAGTIVRTYIHPDSWGDLLLAGADAKLSLADRPDSKIKAVLTPGQPLKLRVVDGDMNLSPVRRDKVMVTIKPAHGGEQIAVLEETSENSGIFEGSVSTALALDVNPPGTLAVYEGESVVVCYVDQARANGARNVVIKLPLTFGSAVIQSVQPHQ